MSPSTLPAGYSKAKLSCVGGGVRWTSGSTGNDPSAEGSTASASSATRTGWVSASSISRTAAPITMADRRPGRQPGLFTQPAPSLRLVVATGLALPAFVPSSDYHHSMIDWSACPAVERDPERVSGAWVFRGTRVPVAALFENLEDGAHVSDFVEWFPGVTIDQVRAVLEHAARRRFSSRLSARTVRLGHSGTAKAAADSA